jgi:hypothetical protein
VLVIARVAIPRHVKPELKDTLVAPHPEYAIYPRFVTVLRLRVRLTYEWVQDDHVRTPTETASATKARARHRSGNAGRIRCHTPEDLTVHVKKINRSLITGATRVGRSYALRRAQPHAVPSPMAVRRS